MFLGISYIIFWQGNTLGTINLSELLGALDGGLRNG